MSCRDMTCDHDMREWEDKMRHVREWQDRTREVHKKR